MYVKAEKTQNSDDHSAEYIVDRYPYQHGDPDYVHKAADTLIFGFFQ